MAGQVYLKQGRGLRGSPVTVTDRFRPEAFAQRRETFMSGPPSGWLCSQTSVRRFDAVVTVASPSVELRSWFRGGSWGRRQRTRNPADDGFH